MVLSAPAQPILDGGAYLADTLRSGLSCDVVIADEDVAQAARMAVMRKLRRGGQAVDEWLIWLIPCTEIVRLLQIAPV